MYKIKIKIILFKMGPIYWQLHSYSQFTEKIYII